MSLVSKFTRTEYLKEISHSKKSKTPNGLEDRKKKKKDKTSKILVWKIANSYKETEQHVDVLKQSVLAPQVIHTGICK